MNRSIFSVALFVIVMSSTAVHAGFDHTFMFVGDSITSGTDSTQNGGTELGNGFRGYLFDNLLGVGDTPTFVGSQSDGGADGLPDGPLPSTTPGGNPFSPNHNGYPGKRIDGGPSNSIEGLLTTDDPFGAGGLAPDIIFLMGGTNDAVRTDGGVHAPINPNSFTEEYIDLMEYLFANTPNVHIVVVGVPPLYNGRPNGAAENAQAALYNDRLADMVDGLAVQTTNGGATETLTAPVGSSMSFLDTSSVLNSADVNDFGGATFIHPSNAGYEALADAMLAHLQGEALAMPEPTSLAILGVGGLMVLRRRRAA